MYIIGITGLTGSGKTTAIRALEKHGALALNCDEIYHELLATSALMDAELKARFEDITTDGAIDRRKIAKQVWNDPAALADLGKITHKHVMSEVERRIAQFEKKGGRIAAIDAIALIEAGYKERCDTIISITAPEDKRISRLIERDGLSHEEVAARMNAQQPGDFYINNSDYIIENAYTDITEFEDNIVKTCLIEQWFHDHADEMIAELSQLIAVNSVRGKREPGAPFGVESRKALSVAQKMLEKHGFEVSVFEDMVITATLGPSPAKLGILTHLDIVEAGGLWDTDPFELTAKDGKLYGRGVADNKGPAIASMYAAYCVRDLFPGLTHGVQLIFGSAEETGFEDIIHYAAKNAMPQSVFSPDAMFPLVNIEKGRLMASFGAKWEKNVSLPRVISIMGGRTPNIVPNRAVAVIEGISEKDAHAASHEFSEKTGVKLSVAATDSSKSAGGTGTGNTLEIIAEGVASHASRPHLGKNAQTALIGMLAAMPFAKSKGFEYISSLARLFPHGDSHGSAIGLEMQDKISGKTTVNFGVLRYDELEFSANFDARTALCADNADLLEITRDALSRECIELSYHELQPGHHTPEDSPFVQTLLRVYEQYTGKKGECLCMGGLTYVHDIPGGVAFGCDIPGEDNNVHGANEFFEQEHLILCAKIFTKAIMEICK